MDLVLWPSKSKLVFIATQHIASPAPASISLTDSAGATHFGLV